MGCMLYWSTLDSAVMLDTTSAILRYWQSLLLTTVLIYQDAAVATRAHSCLLNTHCNSLMRSSYNNTCHIKTCQMFCCVPQASNGQWYQMNDSSVSVSDIRSVLNQQAYVLFYIK